MALLNLFRSGCLFRCPFFSASEEGKICLRQLQWFRGLAEYILRPPGMHFRYAESRRDGWIRFRPGFRFRGGLRPEHKHSIDFAVVSERPRDDGLAGIKQ